MLAAWPCQPHWSNFPSWAPVCSCTCLVPTGTASWDGSFVLQTSVCSEHPVIPLGSLGSWVVMVHKLSICGPEWLNGAVLTALLSHQHIKIQNLNPLMASASVSQYLCLLSFVAKTQTKFLVGESARCRAELCFCGFMVGLSQLKSFFFLKFSVSVLWQLSNDSELSPFLRYFGSCAVFLHLCYGVFGWCVVFFFNFLRRKY